MRHADVGEQLEYLFWVRDRILAAASALSPADFQSSDPVTTRSLRATLAHQIECEWAWRTRLREGAFPDGDVLPEDFGTLDALADRWHREERELRAWFDDLSDEDLAATPPGAGNPLARWRYLIYVVHHGTQQFAEAAVLLTRLGHSPGEIGALPRGPRSPWLRGWRNRLRRVTGRPPLAFALFGALPRGGLAFGLVLARFGCAHAGHGTPSGACAAARTTWGGPRPACERGPGGDRAATRLL